MKRMLFTAMLGVFFTTSAIAEEITCAIFEGSIWEGKMVGTRIQQGDVKIHFKGSCKENMLGGISINYDWIRPNGSIRGTGKLTFLKRGGNIYKNNTGSRGTVSLDGEDLSWVNTYTGNFYRLTVRRSR